MTTADPWIANVPARYALLVLEAVDALGADRKELLLAAGLTTDAVDDPTARVPIETFATLAAKAVELTGEPALGYEIGLSSSLTSHGLMGFGMMTSASLREAIELGIEFLQLRVPVLSAQLRVEGDIAAVSVVETIPLGELRELLFDTFLVKLARLGTSLTDGSIGADDVELWFDYPEPERHRRLRHRLPRMRFEMGSNEVRFAASMLDRRPATADPINAKLIEAQCRRELEQLGLGNDVVGQVRAALAGAADGYPTLAEVAGALNMSTRTLRRRLQDRGTGYHQLLDAARRAEATRLLSSTSLSIEQIARRLGYAEASSFRRAFHGWVQRTPTEFRQAQRTAP
jgi:AraC-like DNA-binding protein